MKLVAVAVVLAASPAHAEAPVAVVVGINGGRATNFHARARGLLPILGAVMRRWTATALLLAASSAHAEAPVGAVVNPGVSIAWVESEHAVVGSMQVDAGYRWNPQTMLGVHLGSATATSDFAPLDLGLSVHVGFDGPAYVAAWIGAQRSRSGSTGTTTAFGLSVGWDIARRGPHRVALTGSVETSIYTSNRPLTYTAVGIGVAYRFWD